jgi:hypothetical protein
LKDLNDAYNVSDEDFEVDARPSPKKHLRKSKKISSAMVQSIKLKVKKASKPTQLNYTVEIVLATWNEETDYGKSFIAMNIEDQSAEVKRLNVGSTKGLKGVIKKKLLDVNFKAVVTAKIHVAPTTLNAVLLNPSFTSVGE